MSSAGRRAGPVSASFPCGSSAAVNTWQAQISRLILHACGRKRTHQADARDSCEHCRRRGALATVQVMLCAGARQPGPAIWPGWVQRAKQHVRPSRTSFHVRFQPGPRGRCFPGRLTPQHARMEARGQSHARRAEQSFQNMCPHLLLSQQISVLRRTESSLSMHAHVVTAYLVLTSETLHVKVLAVAPVAEGWTFAVRIFCFFYVLHFRARVNAVSV